MGRDQNKWNRKRRAEFRIKTAEIKLARGCADCGYNQHAVALDFDHREGEEKLFSISLGTTRTWTSVLEEIAKCDVVCSNCHRVRTALRGEW